MSICSRRSSQRYFRLGAREKPLLTSVWRSGRAIIPKLMGYVADKFDMSRGSLCDGCFAFVAFYGFNGRNSARQKASTASRRARRSRSRGTPKPRGGPVRYPMGQPTQFGSGRRTSSFYLPVGQPKSNPRVLEEARYQEFRTRLPHTLSLM